MRIDVATKTRDDQDIILSVRKTPSESEKAQQEKREQEKAGKNRLNIEQKNADQVTISAQARELQEQMEQIRESGEAQAEEMEKKSKCIVIAGRVASGDKVPYKDMQYLMKNDPELYAQAMKLRVPKDDPKEYDSITEEEEEETEQGNQVSGTVTGGVTIDASGGAADIGVVI